jgi:cation:H+ antiporter
MVIVASEMLGTGATDLIARSGLSQTLVGMTVVALAISIEELRTDRARGAARAR